MSPSLPKPAPAPRAPTTRKRSASRRRSLEAPAALSSVASPLSQTQPQLTPRQEAVPTASSDETKVERETGGSYVVDPTVLDSDLPPPLDFS